ncbi:regulatory protein RecX [Flexivirga caeni]|uniref:Regulatory protein RecX n=1 Tax=Flexivirga caeni TaxID=2294115 RepID=A0A3M9M763_9MICO|nr:regulatory protein RecX [Flexivirga caeni]RNI21419.1 regulatory protein RecX [Flexivirga caeni]
MNPFDSAQDSLPDFLDPADVIVGPWAGSSVTGRPGGDVEADGRETGDRDSTRWGSERRSSGGRSAVVSDRSGAGVGRRAARQARNDREPPADRGGRDADPHEVARAIVLRRFTAAPCSRQQLADTLRERGCDDQVATEVLDRLQEVGLIDDAANAEALVRSKLSRRGLARRAIAQELRGKGFDDDVINDQLDAIDDETERDRARQLVDKKLRTMHGLDATVQARRLAGMLARKGYSSAIAWSVIREAIADAPEHQPD